MEFPVELTVARVDLACGAVFTAYLRDITAQREAEAGRDRAEATLRHQALHDALTGLPNRTLFRERVKDALEQARQAGTSVGVALMDLDRFKEINDTLGHHTGDALLRNLAERLQGALGETDTVARLGGDEFAFLILDADAASAVELAARIESVLGEPFSLQRLSLEVESSIGFAIFPEHGDSVDLLLQRADVAMYAAKRAATQVAFYDPAVDEHTPARLTLVADLRRAIEEHELVLHYQPQIELSTGKVTGVEALVRWEHPIHGLRPPDEFIPAAERSGLIHALTRFVIEQALRQQQLWARDGIRLVVSVNVSMRNLVDGAFPADVAALIGVRDAGGSLALEITEHSFLADGFRARSVLEALSAMGVDVAIDDFGTGFSSLAALRRLPLSAIKIDRSFVRSMTSDRDDAVIVRSTIDLARNLGLRVIAEGVETVGVYNALVALGCDSAQGYYMSRPVPAHELTAWLEVRDAA